MFLCFYDSNDMDVLTLHVDDKYDVNLIYKHVMVYNINMMMTTCDAMLYEVRHSL